MADETGVKDHMLKQEGVNAAWDDLRFPFIGRRIDVASGRIDYDYTELGINFAVNSRYAVTEQVSMICQMHHNWRQGSELRPHLHWIQKQAAFPNWLLEYRMYDNGELPPVVWTKAVIATNVFTYVATDILQMSSFPAIDASSLSEVSAFIDFKLFRDTVDGSGEFGGADPVGTPVLAKEFDVHFMIDSLGSTTELVK